MKYSRSILALAILGSACTFSPTEVESPPAPPAPTVTINVLEDSVSVGQPARIAVCGTHFTEIRVSPGGFTVARCDTLTDYPARSVRYRAFAPGLNGQNAQASDSVTVKATVTPPAPTTATGFLTGSLYPSWADSVWSYDKKTGARTTTLIGKEMPYGVTLPGDTAVRVYWTSASGHYPEPVSVVPMVGHPINEKATFRPIPPTPPTPPTTGKLRMVTVPQGMKFEVTYLRSNTVVMNGIGDGVEELEVGYYDWKCSDPSGKYHTVTGHTDIDAGEYQTVVCILPEKKPDDPPPAPKMYKLITNSTPILGVGVTITKYSDGASVATGTTRMERTLLADVYVVSCMMSGYFSYSEVVILDKDKSVNCLMWKEAEIPPPPTPTTGNLILTDNIEGPVEMQVLYLLPNGDYKPVGAWLTDKVLVGQAPGEYIARCIKPGSKGRIIGDAKATLVAGGTATLRCVMGEKKDS